MCLTALLVLTGCNRTHTKSSNPPSIEARKTEAVTEDRFRTIQDSTYFRSKEKEHDEYNGDYYYYSEQNVDIQWPEQLVSCIDITPLQKALIAKAFGKEPPSTDIDSVVQKFTGTALFLETEENLTAVPVQASDVAEGGMTSLSAGVSIHPFLSSPTLIGFRIHKNDYQGGAHGYYSMVHLIFDKTNCAVVDSAYVFSLAQRNHLIGKINHYITKKGEMYASVDYIPDFFLDQQGLVFVFQPYEIASYADGIIQIKIPYTDLEQLMTPRFKDLLKEANKIHIDQDHKK